MMDFITIPLVVGMISVGIYGLFELFVRKQERLKIIDKIGENLDYSAFDSKMFVTPMLPRTSFSFNALKAGCLLVGLGLGLMVGFFIGMYVTDGYANNEYESRRFVEIIYGASVLLFGGLGLVVSFLIEMIMVNKKDK